MGKENIHTTRNLRQAVCSPFSYSWENRLNACNGNSIPHKRDPEDEMIFANHEVRFLQPQTALEVPDLCVEVSARGLHLSLLPLCATFWAIYTTTLDKILGPSYSYWTYWNFTCR